MIPAGPGGREAPARPAIPLATAPYGLWALVFIVAPMATVVAWSLWSIEGREIVRQVSLGNYRTLFAPGSVHIKVLLRTLGLAFVVTCLSALMSLPVAWYIAKGVKSTLAKTTLLLLIILPFLMGYLVRTIAWRGILGIHGLVNTALLELGLIPAPLEFLLYGRFSVIVALLYNYYPFMFFTLYIALEAMDSRLIAAAFDLGASRRQVLRHVVLPLAMPGIVTGAVMTFVPVAAAVLEPAILGGTSGRLMGNSIQAQFTQAFNWPMGAAMSLVLMAACIVLLAVSVGLMVRKSRLVIRYDV